MSARLVPLAALALLLAACAPAEPPKVASAAPSAGETPAAACLRAAAASRGKGAGKSASEPAIIGVKHVLVKYAGAKNAKNAAAAVTRTREDACLRAKEALDKLKGGADFADVVKEYSDEVGAATRGGSLGEVGRGELAPPFADAAFELSRGQVSDVVESPFGFHLILRAE